MQPSIAPGNRTTKARDALRRSRQPGEEEVFEPRLGWTIFDPDAYARDVEAETHGIEPGLKARDLDAELELQRATRKPGKVAKRIIRLTQRALQLMASGYSLRDAAHELGVTTPTLTGYLTRHKRAVDLGKIEEQLDATALPLAAENLIHGLLAGDKDYTLETLKGRGAFKRHGEQKNTGDGTLPALKIEINMGPGDPSLAQSTPGALTGTISGTPRTPLPVNGTVVSSRPLLEAPDAVQVPSAAVEDARDGRARRDQ